MANLVDAVARRYAVLRPHLSEFQRRLWLGAEAAELGPGGVAIVAEACGVAADTVRRGRKEAADGTGPGLGRSRRPGGGRKRAEDRDEQLIAAFESLIDPVTRGDRMSPLRWTAKSIRALTGALRDRGHTVSDIVTRRLLRESGYSLQANAKTTEGGQHPDRDAQFGYLNDQATDHLATRRPGDQRRHQEERTGRGLQEQRTGVAAQRRARAGQGPRLHRHRTRQGQSVRGVRRGHQHGWVSVGTDHDTAAFAVNTIATWWREVGKPMYPNATRLMISADGGGSNGYRTRQWKTELAEFAAATGLAVTVCHLPPGTSKWNKIEHRLFSHISMNWRGRPLTSHEVIVETIAATTTNTGLTGRAELDQATYPTGVKIPDAQNLEFRSLISVARVNCGAFVT